MTFKQAVRHLEEAGLTVVVPNGRSPGARSKVRLRGGSRRVVPVIEVEALPPELDKMIRQSRAEIRNSLRTRKKH